MTKKDMTKKDMTKKANTSTYTLFGLLVAVSALLVYNFTGAWTNAPANPPQNNTEAPINVGPDAQVKTGNMGANIVSAGSSVWSPEYCDENGENCVSAGGGLAGCVLEYRMVWTNTASVWQSVSLNGSSNQGSPSLAWFDSVNSSCRGDGCGPQMRLTCSDQDTFVLASYGEMQQLLRANGHTSADRVYNGPREREGLCNLLRPGSEPASWTTGSFGQPGNNNINMFTNRWVVVGIAYHDNTWLSSLTCTTNQANIPTTYFDWDVSQRILTEQNRTRTVMCRNNSGSIVSDDMCSAQKPLTEYAQFLIGCEPGNCGP